MTLKEKQKIFPRLVAELILYIYEQGYEVVFSYAFRCKDCPIGRKTSLHKKCLAIDLELFKDGKYLTKTEDHKLLGEYWETLHQDASWGGRFNDGNHYSLRHGNMR